MGTFLILGLMLAGLLGYYVFSLVQSAEEKFQQAMRNERRLRFDLGEMSSPRNRRF